MKLWTIISIIFISALLVEPVMATVSYCHETHCTSSCCGEGEEQCPMSEKSDSHKGDSHCHPYMSCSSCFCYTVTDFMSLSEPVEMSSEVSIIYIAPAYQQAIQSIWRPPKIA